jgi:hypothetical protein
MVYILKGKVSSLRLMAIIWTASSDAARRDRDSGWRQAAGAAARWGIAQAVTLIQGLPQKKRSISKDRLIPQ